MDGWLLRHLVCPRDRERLTDSLISTAPPISKLTCQAGHEYPVIDHIPIMLLSERRIESGRYRRTVEAAERILGGDTTWFTWFAEEDIVGLGTIDPVVNRGAGGCGQMFTPLSGRLPRYPIPRIKVPALVGGRILDVGCYWGRWSISAAREGFHPVGIDVNLDGVRAARRVARQLDVDAIYVVGDARFLPFEDESFDVVWSYSVVQHFGKDDARLIFDETARVLKTDGSSVHQMPNKFGFRNMYNQIRGNHRRIRGFGNIWYWSLPEMKKVAGETVGPTTISVDGYFGLGIPDHDLDLFPLKYRVIAQTSLMLRKLSCRIPLLTFLADSVFLRSIRTSEAGVPENLQGIADYSRSDGLIA